MKKNIKQSGFTLIELLVVIAIVAIIAGMIFKMMVYAGRSATVAAAKAGLEKIAMAVEEYRAEYGIYPPCDSTDFEYAVPPDVRQGNMSPAAHAYFMSNPNQTNFLLFKYGLIGHILYPNGYNLDYPPGTMASSWQCINLTARDIAARKSWIRFLSDLPPCPPDFVNKGSLAAVGLSLACYSNRTEYMADWWNAPGSAQANHLQYRSDPPFTTYELRSCGPDGFYGTADDLTRTSWDK